ncbi:hypothetical protein MPSEU_001085000 [Mayamaea pseudoterrestris]|nr:hypothetical protein MPSEU_001085000 [Mayamaea pseudoterrestris]
MREIPSLQNLCLRSVGPISCSAEATFATSSSGDAENESSKASSKTPSLASSLLRSFHTNLYVKRTPCIGTGSARRVNGNEVDMFHPLGAVVETNDASASSTTASQQQQQQLLVFEHGNPANDCLQSFIDSLVELGRMDDQRLGVHFFEEWKQNVILAATTTNNKDDDASSRKRRKMESANHTTPLGALSLYNCNLAQETFDCMRDTKIGPHLATLDLTGIRGLTNDLLDSLLPDCPNLMQLALKNCRRLTNIYSVGKHQKKLMTLDIGGTYNINTDHVLEIVPQLPQLKRLHASGLNWTDTSMAALVELRQGDWQHLSFSFSLTLSQTALRQTILPLSDTLTCLALAFCDTLVDNATMGLLGRNLPLVRALDVRGNPALTTLTGWYDGRVSADLPAQPLSVLGRYSGLSETSVEETKKVHPNETLDLVVCLNAGGMGAAILVENLE